MLIPETIFVYETY